MSDATNGTTAEHARGETVPVPREEYQYYRRLEERVDELAARVGDLEAREREREESRDGDARARARTAPAPDSAQHGCNADESTMHATVNSEKVDGSQADSAQHGCNADESTMHTSVSFRDVDEIQEAKIKDIWVGHLPLGAFVKARERAIETNRDLIEKVRNDRVTECNSDEIDLESSLPIMRTHRLWKADPDSLSANKRRAAIAWDALDDMTTKRVGVYAFDSVDIANVLAGADEATDRTTIGRVIDVLAAQSDGIIERATGPNGRLLGIVDRSRFEARIDAVRDELDEQEGPT